MCIMIQPSAVQREQNVAEEQPTMTATCAGTNKNAVFWHVYALGPRLFYKTMACYWHVCTPLGRLGAHDR